MIFPTFKLTNAWVGVNNLGGSLVPLKHILLVFGT